MDIDRAIEYPQLFPQGSIGQVFSRKGASCIADQNLKQGELDGSEVERVAVDPGLSRSDVDCDVSRREAVRPSTPLVQSTQNRLDAGDELSRVERLREIVVGSNLQADDTVDFVSAGCQHQHRNGRPRAQLFEELHAAHAGQHDVQDYERVLAGACQFQPTLAIVSRMENEAVLPKAFGEQCAELGIVIDNQQAVHGGQWFCPSPDSSRGNYTVRNLYLPLHSLTNLYRTRSFVVLYSNRRITRCTDERQSTLDSSWTSCNCPCCNCRVGGLQDRTRLVRDRMASWWATGPRSS